MSESCEHIQLREFIERIFAERESARNEAAKVLQVHLDNLNHWKEETLRERDKLMNKEMYLSDHAAMVKRVEEIEKSQSKLVGIGTALIAVSFLIGIFLSHVLRL